MRNMFRKWSRFAVPFAATFVMTGLIGCTRGEVELRNAVEAYTQVLSEALAKPDAQKMRFFASSEELSRIDSYILLMLKEKKVMHSRLLKLDFGRVEQDRGKMTATVTTHEEWTYYYVDEKSRQPVSKNEAIAYNNIYHLIMEQGHWVVDRIDSNETKPTTVLPPFTDPAAGSGKRQEAGKF